MVYERNDRCFELKWDFVETPAANCSQPAVGKADGVVEPARRVALAGYHVELREPPMAEQPSRVR